MPYGTPPLARQLEDGRFNRFLATLPPHDFSLLAPHLRTITLERGTMLHDVGEEIEHVYFPHTGMVSLVAVMQSGATVETATIGGGGVIGASAALGARWTFGRAIVQLPGAAAWVSAAQFHAAAHECQAIRDLVVRYNDLLLAHCRAPASSATAAVSSTSSIAGRSKRSPVNATPWSATISIKCFRPELLASSRVSTLSVVSGKLGPDPRHTPLMGPGPPFESKRAFIGYPHYKH
jgi:CRP-like cAMP-binding protein